MVPSDGGCEVVGMSRNWRNVIVGAAALVVTEEEDRVFPRRTRHECANNVGDLSLPIQDRLTRPWMFIVVPVSCLNKDETGQRAVLQIVGVGWYSGAICVGSMQKELDESPTTLDGCVGGVQRARWISVDDSDMNRSG